MQFRVSAMLLGSALLPALAAESEATRVVVSGERQPQSQALSPLSLGVLDADTIALTGAEQIQQLLNRLPGVQFQRNDGQEYLAAIRSPVLTGAGSCGAFLSLENGVPLRPAPFCNVNELSESHSEVAERIEVIRGPALPFYGANAMHGAVNVLTPGMAEANQLALRVSDQDSVQLGLTFAGDAQTLALTVLDETSWRDDAGVAQQKLSYRHQHTLGQSDIETIVVGSRLRQDTAGFVSGSNAYRDHDRARRNENPGAYRDSESLRLLQHYRWQDGTLLTPYLRYSRMDFSQHFLPGQPFEENGHWSAGLQSQFVASKSDRHSLIAGADLEYADTFLKEWQTEPTEGSAFLRETIPVGRHYDYRVALQGLAPFLHWQYQTSATWRWHAGLRFDAWQYDYDNRMLSGRSREDGSACGFDGCRFNRPADRRDRFQLWSPKAGVQWQPDPSHQLSALLQHGFRPPQTTELYRLQRAQVIADLDPEELAGIELSWRADWADTNTDHDGPRTELALYRYRKDNVIVRNTDAFNIADAKTDHQGIELALAWPFAAQWQAELGLSRQRHRYRNNPGISAVDIVGNRVDTAPDWFGQLALQWRPDTRQQLELAGSFTDGYYTDAENSRRYDGHSLIDLRWRYQWSTRLQLSAQLLNLTDRVYAERADYTSASGDRYIPGAPRRLYVGIDWQF